MASKKSLIQDLQKVSEQYSQETGKSADQIPRGYYRKNGEFKESDYEGRFGRFEDFRSAAIEPAFARHTMEDRKKSPGKKKRFVVTAVIEGQSPNLPFISSLETYCEYNNAELIILPMISPNGKKRDEFHEDLRSYEHRFAIDCVFNGSIQAADMLLNPQQILPLTGLARMGHAGSSLIIASPKQHMTVVPDEGQAGMVHSTGVCTNPDNYRTTRQGRIATLDHTLGALVIEIESDDRFHLRQIQCYNPDGSFYDLNRLYSPDEISLIPPMLVESVYAGDIHCGWIDSTSLEALYQQTEYLKAKSIVIGDVFDGTSISHHMEDSIVEQVNRKENMVLLEEELQGVLEFLENTHKRLPEVTIFYCRGNHDEHLDRYLDEQRWHNDRFNYRTAIECMGYLLDRLNPIEEWIRARKPEILKYTKFLTRNSSLRLTARNIENGFHGDWAHDGMRGSKNTLEAMSGNITHGHIHTPYIHRGVWASGTTSRFDLPYRKGETTGWLAANVSHYPNGQRQLLVNVPGDKNQVRWRRK